MGTVTVNFNSFILGVSIIKLNENGKAFKPPCELLSHFSVDLEAYLEEVLQTEEQNKTAHEKAVREVLEALYQFYKTPLAWTVLMQRMELDFLQPPPYNEPNIVYAEKSKDFCYDPTYNQTEIHLDFMYQFALRMMKENN